MWFCGVLVHYGFLFFSEFINLKGFKYAAPSHWLVHVMICDKKKKNLGNKTAYNRGTFKPILLYNHSIQTE